MKTKSKKLWLGAATLAASVCMAVPFSIGFNAVDASADTVQAEKSQFVVQDGASVRTEEGSSGIRFTTMISQEFFEGLENVAEWGTIIGYEQEDAATLTMSAVDNNWITVFAPKDEEGNAKTITPKLQTEGAYAGYYIYSTVLTYNNLEDSNYVAACSMSINVRSYYKVDDAYVYSYVDEDTDTYRSIEQTAERVLVNDKLANDFYSTVEAESARNILQGYIEATANQKITRTQTAYSNTIDGNKLTGVQVPDGAYYMTINGMDYGAQTVASGVVTLTGNFNTALTLGETYALTLANATKTYTQPMKYVSGTIDSEADFIAATRRFGTQAATDTALGNEIVGVLSTSGSTTGTFTVDENNIKTLNYERYYYALTTNLNFTESDTTHLVYSCWYDIFDGQGHSITVTQIHSKGIFGVLLYGSVAKNFSLTVTQGIYYSSNDTALICGNIFSGARVENVAINLSPTAATENVYKTFGYQAQWDAQLDRIYIHYSANATLPATISHSYGYIAGYSQFISTSPVTNVYVVTSTIDKTGTVGTTAYPSNESASASESKYILGGVYKYSTVDELTNTGVTKVGNWQINDDGSATWVPDSTNEDTAEIAPPVEIVRNEFVVNSKEVTFAAATGSSETVTHTFGTLQIDVASLTGETLTSVYWNDTDVTASASLSGTTVVLSDIPTEGLGEVHTLTVTMDNTATYVQPFRYISGEISSADDFQHMAWWYGDSGVKRQETTDSRDHRYYSGISRQRYYVLTQDITIASTNWNGKFYDIFDGQGHTITISTNLYGAGLFGYIYFNAEVRNLAVTAICTYVENSGDTDSGQHKRGLLSNYLCGTLENVAIHYNFPSEKTGYHQGIASSIYSSSVLKDVYVYMNDNVALASAADDVGNTYGILGAQQAGDFTAKNVYMVSKNIQYVHKITNPTAGTNTYYYAANEGGENDNKVAGTARYDTVAELKEAGVTQVGSWTIGADGIATYDIENKASATYAIDGAKTEYVSMENYTSVEVTGATEVVCIDESIVCYNDGVLTAVGAGKTVVVIDGTIVYVEVTGARADELNVANSAISLAVDGSKTLSLLYKELAFDGYVACSIVSGGEYVTVNGTTVTAIAEGTATLKVAGQINGTIKVIEVTVTVTAE